jgi:hypothetical protein
MDTTNYDTKMAELRAAASQGALTREVVDKITKVGRPKGPEKVVYKRNVEPAMVKELDEIIKGAADPAKRTFTAPPAEVVVEARDLQINELKGQVKALLEDNDRLSKEVATVEHRLSRVARLTDNEKLILWIRKYDELKKVYDTRFGASEHSQA